MQYIKYSKPIMNPPLTCYHRGFIRKRLPKLWALYKFPSRKTSTISNHDYYSTFYANHNQQSFFFLGVTFSSKVLQENTCYEVYVHTSEKVYSRRVLPPSQVCLHLLWFRYQITCQQIETFFPSRAEMKIILVRFFVIYFNCHIDEWCNETLSSENELFW